MGESPELEPWAYVALRGTKLHGVVAPDDKKMLREFYRKCIGYEIKPIYSRDEFNQLCRVDGRWGVK